MRLDCRPLLAQSMSRMSKGHRLVCRRSAWVGTGARDNGAVHDRTRAWKQLLQKSVDEVRLGNVGFANGQVHEQR